MLAASEGKHLVYIIENFTLVIEFAVLTNAYSWIRLFVSINVVFLGVIHEQMLLRAPLFCDTGELNTTWTIRKERFCA